MSYKKSLVTTTDKNSKEGINDTGTKHNVVKDPITPPIAKNNIDTVKKTDKSRASKRKKINPSAINLTKVNNWINQGLLQ